jgi:lipid-A-disaccharide synthase
MGKRRLFISTGEVSGDLQGAILITSLLAQAQTQGIELEIVAIGGPKMAAAGAYLIGNTQQISSIGLLEALPHMLPMLLLKSQVERYLEEHPPDLVILIDYIAVNTPMGGFIRRRFPQIPIVYYIAPQEWAWSINDKNTNAIARITDRLLAIFPEEARYYERHGLPVTFVGHPLVDRIATFPDRNTARQELGIGPGEIAIVLSAASRRQELKYLVPTVFAAAMEIQAQLPQVKFWIPLAIGGYEPLVRSLVEQYGLNAEIVAPEQGKTALAAADLAIAKSGTINLELALLKVPQVVVYALNPLTAWLGRHVLKFKIPTYACPVNLVEMQPVVTELLQEAMTPDNIVQAVMDQITPENRTKQLRGYDSVKKALGAPGVSDRAAQEILLMLNGFSPPSA